MIDTHPPKVIHMPLEELIDPELSFDDPDSAGENPQAYVLKSEADRIAKALKAYQEAVWSEPGYRCRNSRRREVWRKRRWRDTTMPDCRHQWRYIWESGAIKAFVCMVCGKVRRG